MPWRAYRASIVSASNTASDASVRRLKLPVKSLTPKEAADYFGWLAMFAGVDAPASSDKTRAWLNWRPTGPGMIEDLEHLELAEA